MSLVVPQSAGELHVSAHLQIGLKAALIATVIFILTVISTDPVLTFACLIVLLAGAKLLWRSGEPPILFAAFFLQWLQVSLAVFHASFYGIELPELFKFTDGVVLATWLSLGDCSFLLAESALRSAVWATQLSPNSCWKSGSSA